MYPNVMYKSYRFKHLVKTNTDVSHTANKRSQDVIPLLREKVKSELHVMFLNIEETFTIRKREL